MLTGCARYEYDLVRPADLAQHIGSDRDTVVRISPMEYRMRSYENDLVIRIYNLTSDPIKLLGEQSDAVDPENQSHPLRSQTIAPGSFIKLILPPLRPQVQPIGPSIGIGFGYGSAYPYGSGVFDPWSDPSWDMPRYYAVYDNNYYWDWNDEGTVRLDLTYQRDDQKPFTQQLVFRRKKV